jgi:hypothetical protein
VEVPLKATAVVMEGGAEVKLYWRLESDDTYELTGPATVVPESWESMYVQRYSAPNSKTVWPEETGYDASRKMQRNLLTGDAWPEGEIDDNPSRYIQFGIQPNAGNDLKINNISLFACGAGGNGMCAHIYYSTDNFETRTTISEHKSFVANNPVFIQAQPVLTVKDGETLLVRIYPWYNSAATGKTICISDVTISGIAVDSSASASINQLDANSPLSPLTGELDGSSTTIFTPDGRRTTTLHPGINIIHHQSTNKKTITKKIIY